MSLRRGSHRSSPLHSNSGSGIIATAVDDPDHSNSSMDAAQDVALVGSPRHHHHTDMSSSDSPYLNAATFEPTVDEVKTLKKSQQRWNAIVFTVGMAAFFTAFTAMATIRTFFVGICFIWPLVLGPYMIRQRRFILKFPILRRLINRVRFQANRLQVQNNKFAAENARLEGQVANLQSIEFQLHQLCQQQGSNLTELQALIRQNGAIQKQMRQLQDAAALHDLLQAILSSDRDGDAVLSDDEWHRLTLRLQCFNIADEARLQQALRMATTRRKDHHEYTHYSDQIMEDGEGEIMTRGAFSGVDGWMV